MSLFRMQAVWVRFRIQFLAWLVHPAVLAAGSVFGAYLFTLAPTVFTLDSAELTTAAYSLGLVHSPGYPVYLLLAHLFLYLPLGDIGYRANLFSAVASVGTVALLTLLVKRVTGRSLPALIAGLSFGLCFYVWSVSIVAEVYALQGFFLAAMLLSLWAWRQSGQRKHLLLAAGIAGLAVTNSPSTVLWWPGLFLLAWTTPRRRQLTRRDGFALVGAFALALTPLLYFPWRSAAQPAFVYVGHYDTTAIFHPLDLTRLANLWWYLSGRQFGFLVFAYTPARFLDEAVQFLHWLWAAFLGIGLPLGLWGLWVLWHRKRAFAIGLVLTMVTHALFFIGYGAPDKETMFLPVFLVWAMLLGVGLDDMMRALPRRLAAIGLLLPVALLLINTPFADVSDLWTPSNIAQERLRNAAPDSIYVAPWGDSAAMKYYQLVTGLRPDVTVIDVFFIRPETLMSLVDEAYASDRSVYVAFRESTLVNNHYRFVSRVHGYRVYPRGMRLPSSDRPPFIAAS